MKKFGSHILKPDQTIDQEKLGAIVFSDPELLQELGPNHPSSGSRTAQTHYYNYAHESSHMPFIPGGTLIIRSPLRENLR